VCQPSAHQYPGNDYSTPRVYTAHLDRQLFDVRALERGASRFALDRTSHGHARHSRTWTGPEYSSNDNDGLEVRENISETTFTTKDGCDESPGNAAAAKPRDSGATPFGESGGEKTTVDNEGDAPRDSNVDAKITVCARDIVVRFSDGVPATFRVEHSLQFAADIEP
jgi:hypothetical protein